MEERVRVGDVAPGRVTNELPSREKYHCTVGVGRPVAAASKVAVAGMKEDPKPVGAAVVDAGWRTISGDSAGGGAATFGFAAKVT
jgi:hypothetical protein